MKVIMIKKWKKYEIDQIVEVADGFATNFLIKNGYAIPYNKSTSHSLDVKKDIQKHELEKKRKEALELKEKLEKTKLLFYLKTTGLVIHGSISTKKVNQELFKKGFKLEKHAVPHIAIASIGITKIKIKLFDDIFANVELEVRSE